MKNFYLFIFYFFFWGGGGGVTEKQYRGGNYLKRGAWTICRFKGGLARKKGAGIVDTPMHTMMLSVFTNRPIYRLE